MKPQKPPKYATEAAMCAEFLALVETRYWTAYAETAGFDILLVRKLDGLQIGVQAKLQWNSHVVAQSLEEHRWGHERGPDFRAVLVPDYSGEKGLRTICDYIGVTPIRVDRSHYGCDRGGTWAGRIYPPLPDDPSRSWLDEWFDWHPVERCKLPAYVPDVAAGAPAPTRLTDWKVRALKLGALIAIRGFVTRSDMKELGIDHRRWTSKGNGFLRFDETKGGYVPHGGFPPFSRQHPAVFEQIKADADKWMTPAMRTREAGGELLATVKPA